MDWDLYRRLANQWRQVAGCFLGDFYPLTPHSLAEEDWITWQFNRPEQGDGVVQAFRRTRNEEAQRSFPLRGLDPDAPYQVTDFDVGTPKKMTGKELMEQGLPVQIQARPGSAIMVYRKIE